MAESTEENAAPADPDQASVEEARMTFVEHLYDLRKRLRNPQAVHDAKLFPKP